MINSASERNVWSLEELQICQVLALLSKSLLQFGRMGEWPRPQILGQGYDCASAMSGYLNSVQVNVQKEVIDLDISKPKATLHQRNRSNFPAGSTSKYTYYKRYVWFPYLDAIIVSLERHFENHGSTVAKLAWLIPSYATKSGEEGWAS